MKTDQLDQLFAAAAKAVPPQPEPGFPADVLRAVRCESRITPPTLAEQIGALLPRVAFAAALLLAVCFVADMALDSFSFTSLSAGLTQLSAQWLFAVN